MCNEWQCTRFGQYVSDAFKIFHILHRMVDASLLCASLSFYLCVFFLLHFSHTQRERELLHVVRVTSEFSADTHTQALHVIAHKSESGSLWRARMLNVNWYVYFGLCSDYRLAVTFFGAAFFETHHLILDIWHEHFKPIVYLTAQCKHKKWYVQIHPGKWFCGREGHEKSTSISKHKWYTFERERWG